MLTDTPIDKRIERARAWMRDMGKTTPPGGGAGLIIRDLLAVVERLETVQELEAMLAGALAERDAWKAARVEGVRGEAPCRSRDDMALADADGGKWIVPKPVAAEIARLREQLAANRVCPEVAEPAITAETLLRWYADRQRPSGADSPEADDIDWHRVSMEYVAEKINHRFRTATPGKETKHEAS